MEEAGWRGEAGPVGTDPKKEFKGKNRFLNIKYF
jgi:hypothetical protein